MSTTFLDTEIEKALDALERRIVSLNYDGYFTKSLFLELKDALELRAVFRVFLPKEPLNGEDPYVHIYYKEPSPDERAALETIEQILKKYSWSENSTGNDMPKLGTQSPQIIQVWECDKYCCFFSCKCGEPKCRKKNLRTTCPEEDSSARIQGYILLYPILDSTKCENFFSVENFKAPENWGGRLATLFTQNEEPPCFGTFDVSDPRYECYDRCKWKRGCNTSRLGEKIEDKSSLDPDVIIHELKEKFGSLLGEDAHRILILTYDAKKRVLRYRDTNKSEFQKEPEKEWKKYKQKLAEKLRELTHDEISGMNELFLDCGSEYLTAGSNITNETNKTICKNSKYLSDNLDGAGKFEEFDIPYNREKANEIFRYAIQRIDYGITKFLWKTFENYSESLSKINKILEEIKGQSEPPGEKYRRFCETLFLLGLSESERSGFIITPLGYMGQKLGIITAQVDVFYQDDVKKNLERRFYRLATEFSPLLFHSFQDLMFRKALALLEATHPDHVLEILCKVLPICLNTTAIVIHYEGEGSSRDPLVYGFPTAKEGEPFCELDLEQEDMETLSPPVLDKNIKYNVSATVDIDKLPAYCQEQGKEGIRTRSRLLLRGGEDKKKAGKKFTAPPFLLALYFDLSEYGLRRQAPDIVRELSYMIAQLTEAAAQKMVVLEHGIKSATNAIISRNHSHHIGSHVTPRTSITKIKERIKEIYGAQAPTNDNLLDAINHLKLRMDNYVQQKADFMAEIATTSLYTTVAKPFCSQILSRFIHNSLLMDNIGANEGVNYHPFDGKWENRLRINLLDKGEPITVCYKNRPDSSEGFSNENIPYNIHENILFTSIRKNGEQFEDFSIAWPGPLGEFAIYCFLENFIRNAVKHNSGKLCDQKQEHEHPNLNVYINILELDEHDTRKNELYLVEIWDNITEPTDKLLSDLQKMVDPRHLIIENDGSLKKGGWGIAEMRIMANLLGGSDDFAMMDKLTVEKLLKKDTSENEQERLVYRFHLMKAKEILIIAKPSEGEELPNLENIGIYHYNDFTAFQNNRNSGVSKATFSIAVLDNTTAQQIKTKELTLPFRILAEEYGDRGVVAVDKVFVKAVTASDATAELIRNKVWTEWGRRYMPSAGWNEQSLLLFFGDNKDNEPTCTWLNLQGRPFDTLPKLSIAYQEDGDVLVSPPPRGENYKYICYDRHLTGCEKVLTAQKDICFIEQLEANSADFVPLTASAPSPMLWSKLVESGCMKILLIDERLAEAAVKTMGVNNNRVRENSTDTNPYVYKNTIRLEVAKRANIFIATHLQLPDTVKKAVHHSVDILPEEEQVVVHLSQNSQNNKTEWALSLPGLRFDPDVLIIHQGVADTLLKETIWPPNSPDTFKEAFKHFLEQIKGRIPYILVDSGRGIPSDLPENVKFMPFSLLESFVMQGSISKYSLAEIIMCITKSH